MQQRPEKAPQYLLEVQELTKRFDGQVAVDRVNLRFKTGLFASIIGPNGAGKTTFFNLISGVLKASSGKIRFKGRDVTDLPAHKRSQMGMTTCFQITNVFPSLSVLENVRLAVQAKCRHRFRLFTPHHKFDEPVRDALYALEMTRLADKRDVPANALAHGDQRKLEIAIQIASRADLILLDEPTAGISVEEVPSIVEVISEIKQKEEKTIIMVEHKMDILMELSDHIAVLDYGKLIAEGTPEEIKGNRDVQRAYLGGSV